MFDRFQHLSPTTRAALLFIAGIFCFSVMDLLSKTATQSMHSLQAVWGRYASQVLITLLVLGPRVVSLLRTRFIKLQVLRSVFLFLGTAGFFTAIKFMPLAAATAVFECGPLFITLLAHFILREHVGPRRWLAVTIGLLGALIVVGPAWSDLSWIAILPLFAAMNFAGYAVTTRFLGSEENPLTAFLYTCVFGTLIGSAILPFVWEPLTAQQGFLLLAMGACGGMGHYLMIKALTNGEASFLAPFAYTGLVFNTLWGIALFAEVPTLNVVIGAAVIVGSGLVIWAIERQSYRN